MGVEPVSVDDLGVQCALHGGVLHLAELSQVEGLPENLLSEVEADFGLDLCKLEGAIAGGGAPAAQLLGVPVLIRERKERGVSKGRGGNGGSGERQGKGREGHGFLGGRRQWMQ